MTLGIDLSMLNELWMYLPMAVGLFGGAAFNFQKASSSQRSESGLPAHLRRKAGGLGISSVKLGERDARRLLSRQPIIGVNAPLSRSRLLGSDQLLGDSRRFVTDLGRKLFSSLSGLSAARGQLSPENLPGVASGTLTELARELIPQQQAAIRFAATFPEEAIGRRVAAHQGFGRGFAPFVGGGTSFGESDSFGFGISGGS